MEKKNITHFIRRLFNFTVILGLVIGISVITYELRPPEFVYSDDDFTWRSVPSEYDATKWNVLLDSHCHTTASDGVLTPEQSIKWHIAQGFNAMVISDHNTWGCGEEAREIARTKYNDSIKVIRGMEWGTVIHMNLLLPPEVTEYSHIKGKTSAPTFEEIQKVIKDMHDLGGLVIVNHIYNSPEENSLYPTRQQLYDWGVDYFETYNGGILDTESAAFSQLHNMGEIAGTDSHGPDTTYTWNAMNVEFTEEAIFEALRKKETTVLYNASGLQSYATPIPNPYYIPLKPLAMLGNAIESYYIGYFKLDWIGIFVLVGYLYGGFFAYYGLGTLKQKFWEKRTRAK